MNGDLKSVNVIVRYCMGCGGPVRSGCIGMTWKWHHLLTCSSSRQTVLILVLKDLKTLDVGDKFDQGQSGPVAVQWKWHDGGSLKNSLSNGLPFTSTKYTVDCFLFFILHFSFFFTTADHDTCIYFVPLPDAPLPILSRFGDQHPDYTGLCNLSG